MSPQKPQERDCRAWQVGSLLGGMTARIVGSHGGCTAESELVSRIETLCRAASSKLLDVRQARKGSQSRLGQSVGWAEQARSCWPEGRQLPIARLPSTPFTVRNRP